MKGIKKHLTFGVFVLAKASEENLQYWDLHYQLTINCSINLIQYKINVIIVLGNQIFNTIFCSGGKYPLRSNNKQIASDQQKDDFTNIASS